MNMNINFGKDKKGSNIWIDLKKENIHTIFLTGATGTGKSILHYYLYKQLIENNSPEELGFVFMDMTRVDFVGWKTPFLHMPVVWNPKEALKIFEGLVNYRGEKTIFIHIEECSMVCYAPAVFEETWEKLHKNKNIYILFSTSRPSLDVFTWNIKKNTDMIIACNLASEIDSKVVIGKSLAEKFTTPGEKVIVFKDKEILLQPIDKETVETIKKFDIKIMK